MVRRLDETGFGDIKLFQDTEAFCYGIDAVLLADFASKGNVRKGSALDLGTGNGIVPLIISHKMPDVTITGIEIQKSQADLAAENAAINGLDDRIRIIHSDINDISAAETGKFDIVTCNPPYFKRGAGMISSNSAKMTARHETTADINVFLAKASEMLRAGGDAVFVYRPGRLTELLSGGLNSDLYPSQIRFVHPFSDKNANIVLVRFLKGKKTEPEVLPAISVREPDGKYTKIISQIYERDKNSAHL